MNGVDCQYIVSGEEKNELIIGIPETTPAKGQLRLVSSNGEISYNLTIIPASEVTKILWKGMIDLDWGLPDAIYMDASAFEDIPAGARMTLTYTVVAGGWTQIWFEAGDDVHLVFTDTTDGALAFDRSLVPSDVTPGWDWSSDYNLEATVVLTQDILDLIREKNAFNIRGGNKSNGVSTLLTKLSVTYTNPTEETIWTGSFNPGHWGGNQDLAWGGFDWSTVKAGQTLRFYLSTNQWDEEWWQLALRHGTSWGELPTPVYINLTKDQKVVEYVLDQATIDDLLANGGMVITGKEYTLTKITIE